jgi:hypothetical protein
MTRRSLASLFTLPAGWFWLARAQAPPADDLTTIDSDGAAHIKRIVPVPKTISAEAYALIVSGRRWTPEPGTKQAADFAEKLHATFPVGITETTLAGVACKVVVPKRADSAASSSPLSTHSCTPNGHSKKLNMPAARVPNT